MNNLMKYKNYVGSVEFSEEDMVFYGKVQGIKSLISYEGTTCRELVNDFKNAIDEYLDLCEKHQKEPEQAFKGSFNIRINPELHKAASIYAINHDISLNNFVEESIKEKLELV